MIITVIKSIQSGNATTTTTASAEVTDYMSPAIQDPDEENSRTIVRITRALIDGMEPTRYIFNEEGGIGAICTPQTK